MKPRITILPSLRLGGHNNPNPYCPKKGLLPHPKALPLSRGRDATARIRSLGH